MDDADLLRYSRHILLEQLGIEAQEKWLAASALVMGAGGLGAAALVYLASAGVGRIVVADGDMVDLTNLQRQIIHDESRIGRNKAASAAQTLAALNGRVRIETIEQRLDEAAIGHAIAGVDVVLDCTDNFATRHAINRQALAVRVPLVSGAAIRFDGQLASFDLRRADAACYHCLFPEAAPGTPGSEEERCAIMGVFAPLVGVIGSLQAAEALRLLAGVGEPLAGRLTLFDALGMRWREVRFGKDPQCRICGRQAVP